MWNETEKIEGGDGNVFKYVFKQPTAVAEAVLYKYPTFNERTVVCCSTQSGCPVGCRFCGAGDAFVRSLTTEEIVSQTQHLFADQGINAADVQRMQIMFMSMGEPLLNLKALIPAIEQLHALYPKAALLISTSGPDVDYEPLFEVAERIDKIGLQFSVHESTDEARNLLVPFKRKLTLAQIGEHGLEFWQRTGRSPFFNYCVHPENNSDADVARLTALFPPFWEATLSVICERDEHVAAANARQRSLTDDFMQKILAAGYGARMFDPAGQDDIGGGCGQLWFVQEWMRQNPELARPSVGRGLPAVHTPS